MQFVTVENGVITDIADGPREDDLLVFLREMRSPFPRLLPFLLLFLPVIAIFPYGVMLPHSGAFGIKLNLMSQLSAEMAAPMRCSRFIFENNPHAKKGFKQQAIWQIRVYF